MMMKRIFTALCIVAAVLFAVPTGAAKPSFIKDYEWETLKLTNDERTKAGLLPLSTFDTLQNAAVIRADETVRLFDHTRPDGSSCFTVLEQTHIHCMYAAENIAAGQKSPQEVVTAWMNSSGHRANIMSSNAKHLGVGYAEADTEYGRYWVQLFVGGCVTTAIAVEGDVLRVSCNMHPDSFIPLENVQTEFLSDGSVKATYDGKTTTGDTLPPADGSFADVPKNAWYKQYVDYATDNGIFTGTSKYTFSPGSNITRAQFVQVLANLEGVDTSNRNVATKFSDVPSGKWYTHAVKWASENKIVNGVGDGKFNPDANVTREQMCVMLTNYAKFKGITLKTVEAKENFADDAKISKWAKDAVYACQQADIVNGKGAGIFDSQGTGTRAEASVIFAKFHKDYLVK